MKSKDTTFLRLMAVLLLGLAKPVFAQSQSTPDIDIGAMVRPVPSNAVFSEKDYFVWCGSMIKGHDKKYHLFYSRWPKKMGHYAWVTDSEIAHAVADHPNGPYKFVNVVLKARDRKYWDGSTTHNPTVLFKNGKYYLYYMGTTGTGKINYPPSAKDDAWWEYRNNQRIGVAVASDPSGTWKRLDKPVLDIGDINAYDGVMVSNPAVTFSKDNKVVLVYKEVEKGNSFKGGKVRFGVAFANSPFGPFKKEAKPIFELKTAEKEWMIAEDPYIWFQNDFYFAIVRDVIGKYTGQEGALALLVSKDAKDWQAAKHPLVVGKTFKWENGRDSGTKLERPQLYFENGIPKILFGAMDDNTEGPRSNSVNVRVPLKQ
ncbi:glycoside hydrolase family protein [Flavobacterium sp. FlaQc-48]|uniref:glycoside hydrolase family protein n=1 Tax=Flavobacterium sp. FlaQc-48 TaxID=3374181 RepID=UPI0037568BC3